MKSRGSDSFHDRVVAIVRAVPRGRVVTYGQVALLAGRSRAAREVGWIAHAGGEGVPWQRVVNRYGGLATGYSGGAVGQKRALTRDGVRVNSSYRVDLRRYLWWPDPRMVRRLHLSHERLIALGIWMSSSFHVRVDPLPR